MLFHLHFDQHSIDPNMLKILYSMRVKNNDQQLVADGNKSLVRNVLCENYLI